MADSLDPDDLPADEGASLVIPFIACKSQGGPHDDEAFADGFECGMLSSELHMIGAVGGAAHGRWLEPTILDQADLIAMGAAYVAKRGEIDEYSGRVWVTFAQAGCLHGPVADA